MTMRKFIPAIWVMLAMAFFSLLVWAVTPNPTGGAATFSVRTNTSVLAQITTAPTAVDSVFICYIKKGTTDTSFVSQIDSVTSTKLVTNLQPGLNAYFFLLIRQGAGGKTALSSKTDLTLYGPEIEQTPNTNALELTEKLVRAVSWRPASVLETFVLNGTAAQDSSGHYKKWKRNSLIVKATQGGDSVKVMVYTFYGYRDMTQTGATVGFVSSGDSLNVNKQGTFLMRLSGSDATAMYFKFQAYSGNGKNDSLSVYLDRKRN